MNNEEAAIANIRAQLAARGWTKIEEFIDTEKQYNPQDNCHLELFHEDGTRKGWGMCSRDSIAGQKPMRTSQATRGWSPLSVAMRQPHDLQSP